MPAPGHLWIDDEDGSVKISLRANDGGRDCIYYRYVASEELRSFIYEASSLLARQEARELERRMKGK